MRKPTPSEWRGIRDIALFLGGAAGVFHETFTPDSGPPRIELLVLYAAMMGVAVYPPGRDK